MTWIDPAGDIHTTQEEEERRKVEEVKMKRCACPLTHTHLFCDVIIINLFILSLII